MTQEITGNYRKPNKCLLAIKQAGIVTYETFNNFTAVKTNTNIFNIYKGSND